MAGIPALRKKGFLVERFGDPEPLKATAEAVENPLYADLPAPAREALGENALLDGIKLTMPDGSEWFVLDRSWQDVLELTRESRAYYATHGEQPPEVSPNSCGTVMPQ